MPRETAYTYMTQKWGNEASPVTRENPNAFRRIPGTELLSKVIGAELVGCVESDTAECRYSSELNGFSD